MSDTPWSEQLAAVEAARAALAANPGEPGLQASLLRALHTLAARYREAGQQSLAVGLAAEGAAIVATSSATSAVLLDMATNLVYVAGHAPAGVEAADATQTAAERMRQLLAAAPGDHALQRLFVWTLHNLGARNRQAGQEHRSVGLAAEASAVVAGTNAGDAALLDMATNLVYVAAYVPAGQEAVDATQTAATRMRQMLAASPGDEGVQRWFIWTLHNLGARNRQAGQEERSVGLAAEAAAIVAGSTAEGAILLDMANNLVYVAAYVPAGQEAVDATQTAAARMRQMLAASPGDVPLQRSFVWTLHNVGARNRQAGQEERSVGLAAEAASIVAGTTAEGAVLLDMASNLVYIAAYQPAGQEAVDATQTAAARMRQMLAASPGDEGVQRWFVWTLHNLGARNRQAGQEERSVGLAAEAAAIVAGSAADGAVLADMASNLVYVASYLPAGQEAVDATRVALNRLRDLAARNPGSADFQEKVVWAERALADRLRAAGLPPEQPALETPAPGGPAPSEITPAPPPADPWRFFDQRTPIAALSRNPDQMDVFAVGLDGGVWSTWWHSLWREKFRVGSRAFPQRTPIAALSRNPDQMDLFAVGDDGGVYSAWWNGEWHDWFRITDYAVFARNTPLAALSRNSDHMEVWAVGLDGGLWGNWWDGRWHDWFRVGSRTFSQLTPVAALSRSPDHMDLFAVGEGGFVHSAWWNGNPWRDWFTVGTRAFPDLTPVAALSRGPDHMDIFAVGADGGVYSAWWNGNPWRDWFRIGTMAFPPLAPIATLSRNPNQMDIFVVGEDGGVYSAWWNGNPWRDWFRIGDAAFAPGTPITALSRNPNHMEIWAVGLDGALWGNWWDGQWHQWFRLPWSAMAFHRQITSGGIAALGGWATVALLPDGSTRWYGHAHNSGADSYDFGISAILRNATGAALAFSHHGSVQGTLSIGGSRDHDWDEWRPPHAIVVNEFGHFANGQFDSQVEYSSSIESTLVSTVDWAIKWMIGSDPIVMTLGVAIFAGATISSLFSQGSMVPGARLAGSMLWMAGPTNTVLAIAAERIASAGSAWKTLPKEHYDWANERVFRGTLPPREDIVLTDTIGQDDRAFCLPRYDGKITINMGPGSFADPRIHHHGIYGQTFIHELVHAWQIRWNPMGLDLLGRAMAAQINKSVFGGEPYALGAPGPAFNDFNLEQQGNIVSKWFARHHTSAEDGPEALETREAMDDPWFRYIQQNIRTGAM